MGNGWRKMEDDGERYLCRVVTEDAALKGTATKTGKAIFALARLLDFRLPVAASAATAAPAIAPPPAAFAPPPPAAVPAASTAATAAAATASSAATASAAFALWAGFVYYDL